MYTFRPINAPKRMHGTSKLPLPTSPREQRAIQTGEYGEYCAHVRGSLLRLFGEPLRRDGDVAYWYLLEATDTNGATWILTVYEGNSGAAIGGDVRDRSLAAIALALRTLIDATHPADFEATQYHDDYGSTTTYGCRDGVPYCFEARGDLPRVTRAMKEQEREAARMQQASRQQNFRADACDFCEGSGKCFFCKGVGPIEQHGGYDQRGYPIVLPPPHPDCPECGGAGICRDCGGSGTADEEP